MKSTRTFTSPLMQAVTRRSMPVLLRFHLPRLPRWFGKKQLQDSNIEGGMSFEPGHERFTGIGYYSISEQDHELEKLIENKTVLLMTIINR